MRTHDDHRELQVWEHAPAAAELIRPEHLAVGRFELVKRGDAEVGWLDLTFASDGRISVIPGVVVDLAAAAANEIGCCIWPRWTARVLDETTATGLCEVLAPHLQRLTLGRVVPLEAVVALRACPEFTAARAAAELGAAPLTAALPRLASWLHLARLGPASVMVEGRDAALGAAVLRGFGIPAAGSFGPAAATWYDVALAVLDGAPEAIVREHAGDAGGPPLELVREPPERPEEGWCEVAVRPPDPLGALLVGRPDSPPIGAFWVRTQVTPVRLKSGGTRSGLLEGADIAIVVRDDFETAPDADGDEVRELGEAAARAGFRCSVMPAGHLGGVPAEALVVAYGELREPVFRDVLKRLGSQNRRFVVWLQPPGPYPDWHEAALFAALRTVADDAAYEAALRSYDLRLLGVPGIPTSEPPEKIHARAGIGPLLAAATALVVSIVENPDDIVREHHLTGPPPVVMPPIIPEAILHDRGVANRRFALLHAPLSPRGGALLALAAARELELPVVIAGESGDDVYLSLLQRLAGRTVKIVVDPSPQTLANLYGAAAIYLDLSLRPRSLARLVHAVRSGALPMAFADSPIAPLLPPMAVIPRRGVGDLAVALARLLRSPQRANLAGTSARAIEQIELGSDGLKRILDAFRGPAA